MIRPLVFALALTLCTTGAKADRYEGCVESADLERKIRGCTQIIERGTRESLENRASAYFHRGVGFGPEPWRPQSFWFALRGLPCGL
jgi:hypothetical protein